MFGVERHLDAPAHAGAGDAGVLQALFDEGDHLVFAAGRLDEVGVLLIILKQPVGVLAGLEEVGFLLGLVDRAAAVGAAAVLELGLGPETLAGLAVHALVGALVDVALVVQGGEDLLHALHMVIVGGADEAVIADVHGLPQVLDGSHDLVHVLFRGHALGGGLVLDLLAVLVGAGQEQHVLALGAVVAGQRVAGHGGVAVADVQLVAGIVDGGGDVKSFLVHWAHPFPFHMVWRAKQKRQKRVRRSAAVAFVSALGGQGKAGADCRSKNAHPHPITAFTQHDGTLPSLTLLSVYRAAGVLSSRGRAKRLRNPPVPRRRPAARGGTAPRCCPERNPPGVRPA